MDKHPHPISAFSLTEISTRFDGADHSGGAWFRGSRPRLYPDRNTFGTAECWEEALNLIGVRSHASHNNLQHLISSPFTIGSCFASEIQTYLSALGLKPSTNLYFTEGVLNSYTMLYNMRYIVDGAKPPATSLIKEPSVDASQYANTLDLLKSQLANARLIVLTLGLSYGWFDSLTDSFMWKAVLESSYDEKRHVYKYITPEENKRNLEGVIKLIRKINSQCEIVLTVSPVPLNSTFEGESPIINDGLSKSTLLVSAHSILGEELEGVLYWPSYEFFRSFPFTAFDDDMRHPKKHLINANLSLFLYKLTSERSFMDRFTDAFQSHMDALV